MFDFNSFFDTYFIQPILQHQGYNLVNTLVFAAIMIAIAFLVIYPALNRAGIKFNARFMLALIPYILLGITVRVVEDMRLIERSINPLELGFYTYTPGIWVFVAVVTIVALFLSLFISKKFGKDFHYLFAGIGIIAALPTVILNLINFKDWLSFFAIIVLVVVIVAAVVLLFRKVLKNPILNNSLNVLALTGQVVDGSATFVATQFLHCGEQHPLSGAILDINGLLFIAVKVILVLVILYYVDRHIENPNTRGFIKVVIAILGFATGTRSLFTVGAGTCM